MPTPQAAAMKVLSSSIGPMLREAGFRKRRHVFNRTTDDGVTHVIALRLSEQAPPSLPAAPDSPAGIDVLEDHYADDADLWLRNSMPSEFGGPGGFTILTETCVHPRSAVHWIGVGAGQLQPDLFPLGAPGEDFWDIHDPCVTARTIEFLRAVALPWFAKVWTPLDAARCIAADGPRAHGLHVPVLEQIAIAVLDGRNDDAARQVAACLAEGRGTVQDRHVADLSRAWGVSATS